MSEWETSGQSDEWYTPAYIFEAMGDVMFDLDVAAPKEGPRHVPCLRWNFERSLEDWWTGFVWMNAPFGGRNALEPWLAKFFQHGNGIALVPDRTSAPWFQKYAPMADLTLFLGRKVKFEKPDGSVGKSPGSGTALLAIGPEGCKRLTVAAHLGWLTRSEKRAA